jgi:outer membrane autotransporter protein
VTLIAQKQTLLDAAKNLGLDTKKFTQPKVTPQAVSSVPKTSSVPTPPQLPSEPQRSKNNAPKGLGNLLSSINNAKSSGLKKTQINAKKSVLIKTNDIKQALASLKPVNSQKAINSKPVQAPSAKEEHKRQQAITKKLNENKKRAEKIRKQNEKKWKEQEKKSEQAPQASKIVASAPKKESKLSKNKVPLSELENDIKLLQALIESAKGTTINSSYYSYASKENTTSKVSKEKVDKHDITAIKNKEKLLAQIKKEVKKVAAIVAADSMSVLDATNEMDSKGINVAEVEKIDIAVMTNDDAIINYTVEEKATLFLAAVQEANAQARENIVREAKATQIIDISNIVQNLVDDSLINRMRMIGVAAGDEDKSRIEKGLWVKGLIGSSKQDGYNGLSGYKGNSHGIMIGGDLEFDNGLLIGTAFSNIRSNFGFAGKKTGDKVNSESKIFSLYAQNNLSEKVSVSGIVSVSRSDIRAKSKKTIGTNATTNAFAKYSNKGVSVSTKVNYTKHFENGMKLTPFAEVSYSSNVTSEFNETGAGIYNLSITGPKSQTLTGRIGSSLELKSMFVGNVMLVPTLDASVDHRLISKSKAIKTKLMWNEKNFENYIKINQAQKTSVHLVWSLKLNHKNIDLTTSYSTTMKKHFKSHHGTLNLRINFLYFSCRSLN